MGFQSQQSQQVRPMHMNNLLESIGYCSVANINQWMMSIVTILWHGCRHLRHFNTGKRQRRSCNAVFCPALWCTKVLCCLDDPHRVASIIWTACNAGTLSWSGATARSVAWEKSGEKPWQSVADHLIIPTFNVDHHDQKTCPSWCALRRRCVNSYHKTNVNSTEEKIFWLSSRDSSEVHLGLSCILAQPHGSPTIAFHSGQYPLSVCQHGSRCIRSSQRRMMVMHLYLIRWWCCCWYDDVDFDSDFRYLLQNAANFSYAKCITNGKNNNSTF